MTADDPDLGEAVDYILAERPKLHEGDVWGVLVELRDPPQPGTERLALELISRTRPDIRPRDVKAIIREWRAYVSLVRERDWDDDD